MDTILRTPDGTESLYARTESGIVFLGFNERLTVPTSMPDRFEAIDAIAGRDDVAIYIRDEPVTDADPATFRWVSESSNIYLPARYAVDRNAVWALALATRSRQPGAMLMRVDRLDPERLRLLGGGYAADDRFVVFNATLVRGADAKSFTVVNEEHDVARDDRRVYYEGKPIKNADPVTWRPAPVIGGDDPFPFSCDARAAYFAHHELPDSDPSTFIVLAQLQYKAADSTGLYWKTMRESARDRLYFMTTERQAPVCEALQRHDPRPDRWWNQPADALEDPKPTIQPELAWGYLLIDGQPCWRDGSSNLTLKADQPIKADPATFVILSDVYARDASTIFCFGRKLAKADPATFQVLEGYRDSSGAHTAGRWARDAAHVFRLSEVRKVDAASFEQLSVCYARDRDHVYAYGAKVRGVDPAAFEVVAGPLGRCGAKLYDEGYATDQKTFDEALAKWNAAAGR